MWLLFSIRTQVMKKIFKNKQLKIIFIAILFAKYTIEN